MTGAFGAASLLARGKSTKRMPYARYGKNPSTFLTGTELVTGRAPTSNNNGEKVHAKS